MPHSTYSLGLEMKLEERIELSKEDQDIQDSSSSYPHCESFDHIVPMESACDFHREISFEDLKRHRDDYDNATEMLLKLRKKLTDSNLDPKKRKWIEDDLDSFVRKQESALQRIKLAEKLTRRDMRKDPPPAYQSEDPLKDLRRHAEEIEKKYPLDEKKAEFKFN